MTIKKRVKVKLNIISLLFFKDVKHHGKNHHGVQKHLKAEKAKLKDCAAQCIAPKTCNEFSSVCEDPPQNLDGDESDIIAEDEREIAEEFGDDNSSDDISLSSTSSDASAISTNRDLSASSTGGDLSVISTSDDVSVSSTTGGDVSIVSTGGDLSASSTDGDVWHGSVSTNCMVN